MHKTWREKYDTKMKPEVKRADHDYVDIVAGEKLLIPTPAEIEEELRTIPRGSSMTVFELRKRLASKHQADKTCPLTTASFLHIVAEVAIEDLEDGKSPDGVAPFWRIISPTSLLAQKISGGPELIQILQDSDEHTSKYFGFRLASAQS